jgi:putative transcriptional regulator
MEVMTLANHLTALRKKAGFKSAENAAKSLECSAMMIYAIEQGLRKPSPDLAIKMANLFNCSLDEIFLPFYTTISNNSEVS